MHKTGNLQEYYIPRLVGNAKLQCYIAAKVMHGKNPAYINLHRTFVYVSVVGMPN